MKKFCVILVFWDWEKLWNGGTLCTIYSNTKIHNLFYIWNDQNFGFLRGQLQKMWFLIRLLSRNVTELVLQRKVCNFFVILVFWDWKKPWNGATLCTTYSNAEIHNFVYIWNDQNFGSLRGQLDSMWFLIRVAIKKCYCTWATASSMHFFRDSSILVLEKTVKRGDSLYYLQ